MNILPSVPNLFFLDKDDEEIVKSLIEYGANVRKKIGYSNVLSQQMK